MSVEPVLQPQQHLSRLPSLPPPNDVPEVVESLDLADPALRDRDFVDYRADSALRAQIDVACAAAGLARRTACEAHNMQYLTELIQHGLGISILPPASVRAVTAHVATIPITPPLRRDICAVTAAAHPPTGPAQALLDLLPSHT